jgi:phosphate transport system protein
MTSLVLEMLCMSLDAIARLEAGAIKDVVRRDLVVDSEFRSVMTRLVVLMVEDARLISPGIEILFAAKALERMGDHVKNISKHLVCAVNGRQQAPLDRHTPALLLRPKAVVGWRTSCHGPEGQI